MPHIRRGRKKSGLLYSAYAGQGDSQADVFQFTYL